MEWTRDRWRAISAKVIEKPARSGRYQVDFNVDRLSSFCDPDGTYPTVPDEARVIVQHGENGEPRVVDYAPPKCETPGASGTNWQELALEAVREHLRPRD